jgi:hypothetical protein
LSRLARHDAAKLLAQRVETPANDREIVRAHRRLGKVVALHEIRVALHRGKSLLLGFNALEHDQALGLVQQRNEPWQDAPHHGIRRGLFDHRAIELDDVGADAPDALEVRVACTEIVDCHETSQIAKRATASASRFSSYELVSMISTTTR